MSENINFFLNDEINDEMNDEIDLSDILKEINNEEKNIDKLFHEVLNYNVNYTVKQLLLICEYYNILKEVKMTKCNKEEIINNIVLFENNQDNYNIVCRRKQLWFYINEIKNDKFMKKYLLWN